MNLGTPDATGGVLARRRGAGTQILALVSLCALVLGGQPIFGLGQRQSSDRPAISRGASSELAQRRADGASYRGASTILRLAQLENLAGSSLVFAADATAGLAQVEEAAPETIFGTKPGIESLSSGGGGELNSSASDAGHCSIGLATRSRVGGRRAQTESQHHRTRVAPSRVVELVRERVLICSQLDELDYHDMDTSIGKRANFSIQQIHIASSEPSFVFTAVDLICDRLNCSTLTVFNISGHELHDLNRLPARLASWPQLEIVDLSNTSLRAIRSLLLPVDTRPTNLEHLTHLHLDLNRISELDFNLIFERMPNLRHLSLLNNTVFNVQCGESSRSRVARQFDHINLAGNVINCNKTTQMWLLKQIQGPLTSALFPDNDKINCTASYLNEMTWSQRISVLETKICDICDCHSAKKTALQVDCRNKSLTTLPDVLPLNTRILNLTMNHITSLGVPENAKNWENVTYVHLEDNLISSFQQLELNSKFIRNLVALDIRRNKFQEFPSHILEQFVNLDQVHLSDNPWLCDCESTFAFQEWLQRQFHKVGDKEEIRCGESGNDLNGLRSNGLQQRLSSRVIYKLSKSELCPQDTLERPIDWLDIVNVSLGLMIVLILVKVLMDYIYQRRTKRLPHFFKLNL